MFFSALYLLKRRLLYLQYPTTNISHSVLLISTHTLNQYKATRHTVSQTQSLPPAETHSKRCVADTIQYFLKHKETDRGGEMFEVDYPFYSLQLSPTPYLASSITRFVGCLYHQFPIFISSEEFRLRQEGKRFTPNVVR